MRATTVGVALVLVAAVGACGRADPSTDLLVKGPTVTSASIKSARKSHPADVRHWNETVLVNAMVANAAAAEREGISTSSVDSNRTAVAAPSSTGIDWDAIARCETGGDWTAHGSRYSSALGVMNQAVRDYGGAAADRILAGTATRDEQIAMAAALEADVGIHSWACGRKLYP